MDEEKNLISETENAELQEPVSEENNIEKEAPVEEPIEPAKPTEPTVIYRWDYDQEKRSRKKERKNSPIVFAAAVLGAFLIVIGLLVGVLAFRDYHTPKRATVDSSEVIDNLLRATVLINAYNGEDAGSAGSGFFIRQNGVIATNYHIVDGMTTFKVKLYGSDQFVEAKLIGGDADCDLAVLKIEGSGYAAVSFGDSDAVRVGDIAFAVGNPEGSSASWTVTKGIISSIDRELNEERTYEFVDYKMIQTDAAVNPGNSGGMLCNEYGEVIGIIARKHIYVSLSSYYSGGEAVPIFDEGIGYAIPGNGAKKVIDDLIALKSADPVSAGLLKRRPKIGIGVNDVKRGEKISEDPEVFAPADGLLIATANTASGLLEKGDIIVQFKGQSVTHFEQLKEILYSCKRGEKIKVVVYKFGETSPTEVEITLGV